MLHKSLALAASCAAFCAGVAFESNASERVASDAARQVAQASGPASAGENSTPTVFRTKYAAYVLSDFSELPGWREDDLDDAWRALRGSCTVLATRPAWKGLCSRSTRVQTRREDVRHFFETEFRVYQIQGPDESTSGVITGYYEPLLRGDLTRSGRYPYPVYGLPPGLLFLDSRALRSRVPGAPEYAVVEGRNVVPVAAGAAAADRVTNLYRLEIGDGFPDVRDKRIRVRVEESRIVPYYTRAEINSGALRDVRPIAWVDSAAELYSMQVQGSGKIRTPDGRIIRLAYAEQNGHPFTPPLLNRTRGTEPSPGGLLIRGLPIDLAPVAEDPEGGGADDTAVARMALLRGAATSLALNRPASRSDASRSDDEQLSREVSRVVDILLRNRVSGAQVSRATESTRDPTGVRAQSGAAAGTAASASDAAGSEARRFTAKPSAFDVDSSYVFFRQIPDGTTGPIGALGIPLTPTRSVAVDPRTTPLGFPVYIATERAAGDRAIKRLMLAQDTGGAIRGAVRADYFWGFGPGPGERASRLREPGRMWLMIPKDLQVTGMSPARAGMRGDAATDSSGGSAECVVADPVLCVE